MPTDPRTLDAVRCDYCRALHVSAEDTFITVHGNICIGVGGGVVGNNFAEDGTLAKYTVVCRTRACVDRMLIRALPSKASVRARGGTVPASRERADGLDP